MVTKSYFVRGAFMFFCTKDTGESNNGEADSDVSRPVLKKKNREREICNIFEKKKNIRWKLVNLLGAPCEKLDFNGSKIEVPLVNRTGYLK